MSHTPETMCHLMMKIVTIFHFKRTGHCRRAVLLEVWAVNEAQPNEYSIVWGIHAFID